MAHPAQISASCSCSREATPSDKPCGYGEAIQPPWRFSAAWARADMGEMRSKPSIYVQQRVRERL
jgi:hypothetical protein